MTGMLYGGIETPSQGRRNADPGSEFSRPGSEPDLGRSFGDLGRNPIPIIVPCHRVIAHGGKLGGFTGGLAKKRALLAIEGHMPDEVLRAIE